MIKHVCDNCKADIPDENVKYDWPGTFTQRYRTKCSKCGHTNEGRMTDHGID